uniref:Uncharacterized protein n=1 Tax=Meloidogyne incognita TaxID=6306 RepID=A0A914MX38_MELIC
MAKCLLSFQYKFGKYNFCPSPSNAPFERQLIRLCESIKAFKDFSGEKALEAFE